MTKAISLPGILIDMGITRVVYIISEVNKSLAFEWIAERLDRNRFELTFFLIGQENTTLANRLEVLHIKFVEFPFRSKKDLPFIFIRIFFRLWSIRPHVVHTHLFYANLIGLTASWILRIKKRIYTRHHAMVHYNEYPSGLKWDRFMNKIATNIIAISVNTKDILEKLDKAKKEKISVVNHGFDLNYFRSGDKSAIQNKYKMSNAHPIIGVIARYLELKGIQFIIPAFKQLLGGFPDAHLVLANAVGNYKSEIQELLKSLPSESYTEIEFEEDLASLYKLFDVYVHVPIDYKSEAFGQTYVEALAAGIPSVFTISGVSKEFIKHEVNALVVDHACVSEITQAIKRILVESDLRNKLVVNGKKSIEQFSVDVMIANLSKMYE